MVVVVVAVVRESAGDSRLQHSFALPTGSNGDEGGSSASDAPQPSKFRSDPLKGNKVSEDVNLDTSLPDGDGDNQSKSEVNKKVAVVAIVEKRYKILATLGKRNHIQDGLDKHIHHELDHPEKQTEFITNLRKRLSTYWTRWSKIFRSDLG